MKNKIIVVIVATLVLAGLSAQNNQGDIASFIQSTYSTKSFTGGPVSDADLEIILRCGIKAPSARNSQRWKFTVVRDMGLARKVISNSTEGNVLIIVSGQAKNQPGVDVAFDCALATQNMYLAAQSLGLGAHIYSDAVNNINKNLKEALMIPKGYEAIAILRIGNKDGRVDATSAASRRKDYGDIVNESVK